VKALVRYLVHLETWIVCVIYLPHNPIFLACTAPKWTRVHGYFVCMGGFTLHDPAAVNQTNSILTPDEFLYLLENDYIDIPRITRDEIEDRSKYTWFTKLVALCQTVWFLIRVIARGVQRLPITELELLTSALAGTNWIIYLLCWNKPFNVQYPIPIVLKKPTTPENWPVFVPNGKGIGSLAETSWDFVFEFFPHSLFSDKYKVEKNDKGEPIPWFIDMVRPFFRPTRVIPVEVIVYSLHAVAFCGMSLGGIHCVGWFFYFPTRAELILWRVCSVVLMGVPFSSTLMYWLATKVWSKETTQLKVAIWYTGILLHGAVYGCARFTMAIEALASLRALPPGAYEMDNWSSLFSFL
jgi:hypothetical protein